jgi:hypothetical protein
LLGAALVSAVAALSGVAHADDAQALFDEGLADMRAGRFKIGCALIKQSLDIDPRPGTLFTLAECYSRAGKYASAVDLYDRYLAVFETMTPEQRQQQQARADVSRSERTRLVALVSFLTVRLPADAPAGVVVTKDGEAFPAGLFGVSTAIDPGTHIFTTRAPDGPLIEQRIDVNPGERKEIVLAVRVSNEEPAPAPTPTETETEAPFEETQPPAPEPEESHGPSPWVWVTGGVGVAGFVTAGVAGALLLDKRQTIKDQCPSHVCSQKGLAAVHSAQDTLAPLTTVGFVVGGAGAVATVLLLVLDRGGAAAPPAETTGKFVPTLGFGPGGASVGVHAAF